MTETVTHDIDQCPICAEPFKAGDLCASDITEGTCHAACLEGSPVVDLETGEEEQDGVATTFRYGGDPIEKTLAEKLRRVLQTMTNDDTSADHSPDRERFQERSNLLLECIAGLDTADPALIGIAEEVAESGGHWTYCSGCYDTEDGQPTQKYSYSPALQTPIGCGCHECGGLGAVWWHMTDEDVADFEKICEEVDTELELTTRISRLEFVLRGLSKAYAACNGEDHPAYEDAQRVLGGYPDTPPPQNIVMGSEVAAWTTTAEQMLPSKDDVHHALEIIGRANGADLDRWTGSWLPCDDVYEALSAIKKVTGNV